MEIRDWVRAIGARLALIAVVAGVAAILAGALALFQPEQYRATATVVLPDVPTFGPLTAAVGQRVANFESAVTSDGVLDAVAETTGEPRTSLDTVSSARGGTGNVLEVRFVGRDADRARQVVVAASREALLIQAETDAAFARAVADASEVAYDDAQRAYDALAQETGIFVSPEALLSSLEREFVRENRAGNDAALDDIGAELLVVQDLQRLRDAADAALGTWSEDLATLRQAEGRVAAAQNADVRVGDVVQLSRFSAVIRQGAYAALFGAALAVGFVVIVELLRSGTGAARPSLPRPTRQRTRTGAF